MIDSYERIEKIGEGTYGIVYKARHRETNKIVALKKVRIENENEGIPPTTIREISLLKSLDHPNIIKLLDVLNADNKLYIVFEFLETDLRKFIDEATYGASVVKKIVYQLFLALNYIHARGILHRDIKPQNILVDKNLNIRLADFGISRCINVPLRTYTDNIITLWYRPPELILGVKYYSCQVDVWGVGCIMAELVAKKVLFPGDSEIDQLYRIFRIRGTPNEKVWKNVTRMPNWKEEFPYWEAMGLEDIIDAEPEYINLMEKCLTYDPIKRATPKKALEHAFFK